MKLSGRRDIEALTEFKGRDDLVTSLYLETDKGRLARKEIQTALKNMLNGAKVRWSPWTRGRRRRTPSAATWISWPSISRRTPGP